jgi:hypothetical protein
MQARIAAAQPAFVVVRTRSARAAFAGYEGWLRERYAPVGLPDGLAAAAASRGLAVFARR